MLRRQRARPSGAVWALPNNVTWGTNGDLLNRTFHESDSSIFKWHLSLAFISYLLSSVSEFETSSKPTSTFEEHVVIHD